MSDFDWKLVVASMILCFKMMQESNTYFKVNFDSFPFPTIRFNLYFNLLKHYTDNKEGFVNIINKMAKQETTDFFEVFCFVILSRLNPEEYMEDLDENKDNMSSHLYLNTANSLMAVKKFVKYVAETSTFYQKSLLCNISFSEYK